ncbi:MAG: TIGR02117 family protein [Bacteroidetes bacterium]|nr:TIGR02117 family protein [Bacteroidota bacterium]
MHIVKSTIRYLFRFILGFAGFVLVYLLASWLLPFITVNNEPETTKSDLDIFIESNGVHTDFVLPVQQHIVNWNRLFPYSDFEEVDSTCHYVSVGWGDKGFFLNTPEWKDLKASTAFNAAFGLSSTAMHITYHKEAPVEGPSCIRLKISRGQYYRLILYIYRSFQWQHGKLMHIDHPGYNRQDCFYEANGAYHMFKTCNVWTGNGLKNMGIRVGVWTPFQGGIMEHIGK